MMKKVFIISAILLVAVFGAGCVNVEKTNPGDVTPPIPPVDYPPSTIEPIVGEWEGFDSVNKISYDLTALYDGYAKLEIDYENSIPEHEYKIFGAWEGDGNSYLLKLSDGNYSFEITKNKVSGVLTTPSGTKITMRYDSH